MPFSATYVARQPSREEVAAIPGPLVLEFGTAWCGYCRALDRDLAELLDQHPQVRHLRVEDGKGRPLGRSFRVKLWPTLVFLKDGQPLLQMSRPDRRQVEQGLKILMETR